jgi:hypothetical protein
MSNLNADLNVSLDGSSVALDGSILTPSVTLGHCTYFPHSDVAIPADKIATI